MTEYKTMLKCDVCGADHQMGQHVYDGKFTPNYQMEVCKTCFNMNWDGWGPSREAAVISHLNKKGIPIPLRNEEGWIPRGM